MKAIDTNLIARYVMRDDPRQADIAEQILQEPTFVPVTVLLETAWLLASRYRLDRMTIAATLADLISLPAVAVDDPPFIGWAIEQYAEGADIADMLHLVEARVTDAFVTFDRDMASKAGAATPVPIETLGA